MPEPLAKAQIRLLSFDHASVQRLVRARPTLSFGSCRCGYTVTSIVRARTVEPSVIEVILFPIHNTPMSSERILIGCTIFRCTAKEQVYYPGQT